ncbi:MAG: phage protease [Thermoplasmataceae archaeon]
MGNHRTALEAAIAFRETLSWAGPVELADQGHPEKPEITADGKFVKGRDFRIFPIGRIGSTKGNFLLSAEGAKAIAGAWATRKNPVQIDYEHGLVKTPAGEPVRTAGWCRVEARADGLYATDVRWTKEAFGRLASGEYQNFSPLFDHDDAGNISSLENLALTVDPATHAAPTLVAASAVPYASHPVVDGPWDADAAEHRLRKWASSDGSGDTGTIDWKKYGEGFAFVDGSGDKLGDYKLPHHDVRDGKLVTSKRGVEAAAGAEGARGGTKIPADAIGAVKHHLAQHYHEWGGKAPWETQTKTTALSAGKEAPMAKHKKLAKYLKGRIGEHELEPKELAEKCGIDHDRLCRMADGDVQPEGEELKKLAKGLGVKHDHLAKLSEEDEAGKEEPAGKPAAEPKGDQPSKSQVDDAYKVSEETPKRLAAEGDDTASGYKDGLKKLTALANTVPAEQKGLLDGLVAFVHAAGSQIESLSAKVETLSKDRQTSVEERLLDEALSSGRVTPAMKDWAVGYIRANGESAFRSYLSVAPRLGPGVAPVRQTGTARPVSGERGQVSLSSLESVSAMTGTPVEELRKRHEARIAAENAKLAKLQ